MTLGDVAALWYGGLGLGTLALHAWDKWQAVRAGPRVPEIRLHLLALLGGFAGAWLGMRLFRHKTRKPLFLAVTILAAVLHLCGWVAWVLRQGPAE